MTRRKLVALVAAIVLFSIGFVVLATGLFLTRTDYGRAKIREVALPYLQRKWPNAKIYVGKVGGSLIGGITIDSIAVRDARGDLFLSTGRVTLEWNWRDLIDYRIYVSRATVEHPYLHIAEHEGGQWNFREIFASPPPKTPQLPKVANTRGFGDFIVIDSVTARNTTFLLTMPWHPDTALRGARRDSSIKAHLADSAKSVAEVRCVPEPPKPDARCFGRTYAWRDGTGFISHIRLSDPDSNHLGKLFRIGTLAVDMYNPTFSFKNLRGDVRLLGDSVWMDVPHFDMPASTGSGTGKVWWGSDLPVRYAIDVHGDSVSLDDVNWVYPTLPHTGGGSLDLAIRNDPKNLHVVDFRLQKMDVRSTGSHLTGDMWFGTGEPVLLVRNVNLKADPVSFDLIRTLNGKPFPYDWRGDIFGTVRARGGPLTNFVVDDANATFRDAHVPGAVSRFTGRGELDILQPAYTAFHGFNVDVAALDLRTIEFLNPAFPRMGGIVSGTATLDSSWLDVRFSNANIALQNGPGEPTRVTGSGRVTYGTLLTYDLDLDAQPLNATMLARSPALEALPIRGLFSGPLRIQGQTPALDVATSLQSDAGSFSFDGRIDADSVGGYAAHGRGEFSTLNVGGLLDRPMPTIGLLSGHYDVALDSIAAAPSSLTGDAFVSLDRTIIDSIRVQPTELRVRFADGRLIVDSARIKTDAFTATLNGAVGLPQGTPDSMRVAITLDSLGGLRPIISHPQPAPGSLVIEPDSLAGSATVQATARGTLDALALSGTLTASQLYFNKDRGDALTARFDLEHVLTPDRTGLVSARVDSVTLGGIALDTIGGSLRLGDSTHRAFTVGALSHNGPTLVGAGRWTDSAATQVVVVDSLALTVADAQWRLTEPARLVMDSALVHLDSATLRNRDSGYVAVTANVPATGSAFARLRVAGLPLADVGTLIQLQDTLRGSATMSVFATGTKQQPVIDARVDANAVKWGALAIDRVAATAHYDSSWVTGNAQAERGGAAAINATARWPFDVTLFSMRQRNDQVFAKVAVDNASGTTTDLSLFSPLFRKAGVDSVKGRLSGSGLEVNGTVAEKTYRVGLRVDDGQARLNAAGVTFRGITGDIRGGVNAAGEDSVYLNIEARTNDRDHVRVRGRISNLTKPKAQRFDLRLFADSLHAFNRRSVADIYLSTPDTLRLVGSVSGSELTGSINIDRGAIFLSDPDLARKLSVATLDTSSTERMSSAVLDELMTNLRIGAVPVTLGEDVRLKSSEADVRLTGQLDLIKSNNASTRLSESGQIVPGLTLSGTLFTVGGTYNLNFYFYQREFAVLSGGTVTFDGSSPETPLVDIEAQYNVKRLHDRPLGIIVNLAGRLPNPTVKFSSDADYPIDTSDLLSYLITGAPGFDFSGENLNQNVAAFFSPTVSALAGNLARKGLGGLVETFQLELGAFDANSRTNAGFTSYLQTATVEAGRPLYKNVYLGVNAGLCGLAYGRVNAIGVKVEYRFQPDLSFQAAFDPSAQSRMTCDPTDQTVIGLLPSPSQFSFSVRKTWRF
jgi:translocation and assembly module TamB